MARVGEVTVPVRPVFVGPSVDQRFPTSESAPEPTHEMREASAKVRAWIVTTAHSVEEHVPDGRWKSLALTALEEALMWANKAIYNEKRAE